MTARVPQTQPLSRFFAEEVTGTWTLSLSVADPGTRALGTCFICPGHLVALELVA